MRQILMLTAVGGTGFAWAPGQVVELDDDEAAKWADGERARYLEPADFILQHQQLTDDEVEQLKARFLEAAADGSARLQVLEPTGTPAYVFDILDAWASGEPLDFGGHPVPDDVQERVAAIVGGPAKSAEELTPPPLSGTGSGRDAWAAYAEAAGVEFAGDAKRDDIIAACTAAGVPTGRTDEGA